MQNENMIMFELGVKIGGALAGISFLKVEIQEADKLDEKTRKGLIEAIDAILGALK